MADKSFVLLSLNDEKAKKLSNVLGNVTCRKILDYLASKGDATETQISNDLKLPISTVHYNMKLLTDNGLISKDEYHYSDKGKEVIHYKMRNRYIVIAPDNSDEKSILDKLKGMLPAVIVLTAGTFIVGLYEFILRGKETATVGLMAAKSVAYESSDAAVDGATQLAAPMTTKLSAATSLSSTQPHYTLWFFIGGLFVLICSLLWNFARK